MSDNFHYGTPELRKLYKAYCQKIEHVRQRRAFCKSRGYTFHIPDPRFPEECRGMKCGAKTRSGGRCGHDGTSYTNGRCRFHGGKSTGPRTEEGKRRVAENGKSRAPDCPI